MSLQQQRLLQLLQVVTVLQLLQLPAAVRLLLCTVSSMPALACRQHKELHILQHCSADYNTARPAHVAQLLVQQLHSPELHQ